MACVLKIDSLQTDSTNFGENPSIPSSVMATQEENMNRDEKLFERLCKAVRDNKLNDIEDIRKSHPGDEPWNKVITDKDQTVLHIAVENGREHILKELVGYMSANSLEMKDSDGYTALTTAAVLGNWPMVDCMLNKNPDLISTRDSKEKNLHVVMAIDFGQIEMARCLYYRTPKEYLIPEDEDRNGATLLTCAIYAGALDIALELMVHRPLLAFAIDKYGDSPILALASMRQSFPSGNQLRFWKQSIYSCMHIPSPTPTSDEARSKVSKKKQSQNNQENRNYISVLSATCCYLGSRVLDFFGITQLYEMKKIHVQSNELLSQMSRMISESKTKQLEDGLVYTAICRAAKNGIVEFVSKMLETDQKLILWTKDINGRNIFMLGVLHRQEKIFSFLYRLGKMNRSLICSEDKGGNNMLHMAGMIEDSTKINQIPGAALQMQRELQWFKEVERIVRPMNKETQDRLTPQQLFTKKQVGMKEKEEKWMKNTATSCTVVGTLIVTIMFAAVFSLRGDNQSMGLPNSLNNFLFMNVFIISDALSLFSSSRQMIIGLLTLFCSIATMMITFSSALLIILHEQLQIAIPIICLTSVPVSFFIWIQFPILKDMIISTYGPTIFDKKMKSTKLI